MMVRYSFYLICLFLSPAVIVPVKAQVNIRLLAARAEAYNQYLSPEKLYLHFDKSDYTAGDTLWFKAYLFNGISLSGSEKSGIYYIELADDSNKVVKRLKFPIHYGLGWGNITLDTKEFPEGTYTLRAYTNWMRNFGEEAVFTRTFSVSAPKPESWLVRSNTFLSGGDTVRALLQFYTPGKRPVGLRELEIRVMEGKKVLYKDRLETEADGTLDLNFALAGKADGGDIRLTAQDLRKGESRRLNIPLAISRAENTDLQFMPEGGNLVSGLTSRIGFKAIGEDGRGVSVEGRILNSKQEEAARFESLHKGMGSFELRPGVGESYTAAVALPDGSVKTYPLPQVKAAGTVLRINNLNSDSLEVSVSAGGLPEAVDYYLIGQTRGKIYYSKALNLNTGTVKEHIPKSPFPSGIARFTLFNKNQPLNERIVFIDHQDKLNIRIEPDNSIYNPRDSIALHIQATDKEGKPVQGSFSLAVTDDSQVKIDSTAHSNIFTCLLLTSGLKGTVEEPNYYTKGTPEAQKALDNLLLTQGWTDYDWEDVFHPKEPEYAAEPEFIITGKASSTLGGIPHTKVVLYSQKPLMLLDTLTDQNGRFVFRNLPMADSVSYLVQSYNRNGKSFIVDVEVDEWEPPVFGPADQRMLPWYVNNDSIRLERITSTIERKKEEREAYAKGAHVLEEVTVTAKKIVPGSYNLNGPGGADQVLNEEDMKKEGKIKLYDLLLQRIEGLKVGGYRFPPLWESRVGLLLKGQLVKIVIDGIDADRTYQYYQPLTDASGGEGLQERYQFLKNILDEFTAEDILGIEVIYSAQYNSKYNQRLLSKDEMIFTDRSGKLSGVGGASGIDYAYLEITTRNGKGPFIKKTPGVYLYRPLPFTFPKKFYRPRYAVKDPEALPDLRSTLHWEPNIVTDADGKAFVSFYAADKPASYSFIIEGSDMNGRAGSMINEGLIRVE